MIQRAVCTLILSIPLLTLAQVADAAATKNPRKSSASKLQQNLTTKAKGNAPKSSVVPKTSSSRIEIRATAKNMAVAVHAVDAALTSGQLTIAERVEVGTMPCELANHVVVEADPKTPGYFNVQVKSVKGVRYRMVPIVTSTGAVRLEDQRQGAVWLQLANKSMLMNQRLGQREADECMSPVQMIVAEGLKKSPAPSLLEPLPAPISNAVQAVAAPVATTPSTVVPSSGSQ